MCGIAGIVSLNGSPINPGHLALMNAAIAHRGPDDEGYALIDRSERRISAFHGADSCAAVQARFPRFSTTAPLPKAHIGLAHRRFSIIDLSDAAHQPFISADGQYCMVYNGELYNYVELRDELEQQGAHFITSSDTEVFLEAYKLWGKDCFAKFNGFWSCAIYECRGDTLIFSRDRIGKKGFYIAENSGMLYFASEIKSLLAIPSIRASCAVNEKAAYLWLAYGKKNIDEETFFAGIRMFPKAAVGYADDPARVSKYWLLPRCRLTEKDISSVESAEKLHSLLCDAVRIRLRADVPLGIELSGGMDSSVIAAACAACGANRTAAYTVRFGKGIDDEVQYAQAVSRHLGMPLSVIDSPETTFWSGLAAFTRLHEEPYHSPNLKTNMGIWLAMRARGIKVSLNGAAGDECFAGYRHYYPALQLENLRCGRIGHFLANAARYSENRNALYMLTYPFLYAAARAIVERFPSLRLPYRITCAKSLFINRLSGSSRLHDDMDRGLMPYWMASGDRDSMGVPFEVRMPFLDYRIVEFAFTLPVTYLVRDGWHKWIVRKAFERDLPASIIWRRRKTGFPFPIDTLLSHDREIISRIAQACPSSFIRMKSAGSSLDWKALSFILWYRYFILNDKDLFGSIERTARQKYGTPAQPFLPCYEKPA